MNHPTRSNLTVSALVAASSLSLLSACDQPRPRCSIAHGDFAARYTLIDSTGPCESPLLGETLGVHAYYEPRSQRDRRPDFNKTSIAIQPSTLTGLLANAVERGEPNPEDRPFAFGGFAQSEPSEDFCMVPTLSTARVRLPDLPEKALECEVLPPEPAVDVSYTFSNVKVYVTAGAYGTQLAADLTYTKGECTARYQVTAVYPAVYCGVEESTAAPGEPMDGGMMEPAEDAAALQDADQSDVFVPAADCEPPPGPQVPDDSLCSAVADPEQGRDIGSGINPDFAVQCDPELLYCVLSSAPPSLR